MSCKCDNQAVVAVLATRTCRDQKLKHLLRCLFFFEASFQFTLVATYIAGSINHLADDLSRNKLSSFLHKMGHRAEATPTPIPLSLTEMLITQRPDWSSHNLRLMFSDIFNKALLLLHIKHTEVVSRSLTNSAQDSISLPSYRYRNKHYAYSSRI